MDDLEIAIDITNTEKHGGCNCDDDVGHVCEQCFLHAVLCECRREMERLTDLKRTCQCSEEDQCMFARERDEWRGQCNYWRRKYGEAQDELVDLAARAAGGE